MKWTNLSKEEAFSQEAIEKVMARFLSTARTEPKLYGQQYRSDMAAHFSSTGKKET